MRSFAELVLNEIRTDVDGEAKLLTDKQAFSEFMDRVNERYCTCHGGSLCLPVFECNLTAADGKLARRAAG